MPWKSMNKWLWDGDRKSKVPPIAIKKGSPITNTSLIAMFINNGPLNWYINKYLNNFYLHSIPKEELLIFIKKCIFDYKIKKYSTFYSKRPTIDKLFDALKEKNPLLKKTDISLLAEIVAKSPDRNKIFETLGLDKPKVKKTKKKRKAKISQKVFLAENFVIIEVK